MLSVVRRSQTALVASLASLVMLGLVICPCPAMLMSVGEAEPSHDCCAAKEGLSALTVSCCTSHDTGAPRTLSTAPPVAGMAAPAALPAAVARAIPPTVVPTVAGCSARAAAPPVLRI